MSILREASNNTKARTFLWDALHMTTERSHIHKP